MTSRNQHDDAHARAQTRWKTVQPDVTLTWGVDISGDNFIEKAASHGAFGPTKNVLEIGPGYGRLLEAFLRLGIPFAKYVAVEVSENNVPKLRETFTDNKVQIMHDDIEAVSLRDKFDSVLSSLTFKHLYPSFEAALRNVYGNLRPGARVVFDLIEGEARGFIDPASDVTFIREYSRDEVREILENLSLELVAFDEVEHDPEHRRLLVVAGKPEA